jgi:predicted N-acetyltransferase YhbS
MLTTSRPYTGEADYALLRDFLITNFAMSGPPDYGTLGDLDWWRFTEDDPVAVMKPVRLWLDRTGRVVGFVWPGSDGEHFDMFSLPDYRHLESEMLAYSENYLKTTAGDTPVTVEVFCYNGDMPRTSLLEQAGFARTDDFVHYWLYDLTDPLPEPTLPPGYSLSSVKESRIEAEQRVALHRSAFTASRLTAAKYQAVMHAPTYRPELDLVVTTPEGELVAFALAWFDSVNKIGMFDPVGCHAGYQRRGLTRAVMLDGLHKLKALDGRMAILCSSGSDAGATGFYQTVGFKQLDRMYTWTKTLS